MGTGQTIMAVGAMLLLTTMAIHVNSSLIDSDQTVGEHGLAQSAVSLAQSLIDPRKRADDFRLKIEDHTDRLKRAFRLYLWGKRDKIEWTRKIFISNNPINYIVKNNEKLYHLKKTLVRSLRDLLSRRRAQVNELHAGLIALNPTAILNRGYSITRLMDSKHIVTDAHEVSTKQKLEILLAKGRLYCRVEEKTNGKENI